MPRKPVIMIIDDDTTSLSDMLNALARRFGQDYRVVSHLHARDAIEDLIRIRADGESVALLIADQWMPEMIGVEFLQNARLLHPEAQRALLVSWGDHKASSAILQGCGFGDLDNYILKPFYPTEVHLYPIIEDFLCQWTRRHGPRGELVRVIGNDPSPRSHEIREFLERFGIPHAFYSVASSAGQALTEEMGLDKRRLPAVILLDGRVLLDPSNVDLADEFSFSSPEQKSCDLAIIGAGPAGLAAAVYSASEGLQTLVIEREMVGGQAGTSSLIRNYLGFPRGISGTELTQRAYQQAWLFGAKYILAREVRGLRTSGRDRIVILNDGTEITARAVLIASGAAYRQLNIPELEQLSGAGVFYAAGSESLIMKNKEVMVVGGGNSAGQAVMHLARSARQVYLVVRRESLKKSMSDYLIQGIRHLRNVKVLLQHDIIGGAGEHHLESVRVQNLKMGNQETLNVSALFVLIGAQPHTGWLADSVKRDEHGFIITGSDLEQEVVYQTARRNPSRFETSMPGVFAAGDARCGSVKRVASAVGEGSMVIHSIHEYLEAPVTLR